MKTILIYLFLVLATFAAHCNNTDSLYSVLEKTMAERNQFDREKEVKLTEIKALLNDVGISSHQRYNLNNQLIAAYKSYNFDSTLNYVQHNIKIAEYLTDNELTIESKLKLCALLSSSGRDKEAIDILEEINRMALPEILLEQYFTQFRESYINLSYHATLEENIKNYISLSKHYTDSLLQVLEPNSIEYMAIKEEQFRLAGNLFESKKLNSQILANVSIGTRTYSITAYNRSQIYLQEHDVENQKKFLILSAISDIKASIKDNASLANLALVLYKEKTIDKAYRYINFAMEDALFFNSSLRFISISNILPLITEDYQRNSDIQKARLRNYLWLISLLSLISFIALFYNYLQMKSIKKARNDLHHVNNQLKALNADLQQANYQLKGLNQQLSESNHVKEHYIANFLTICSNYIQKLDGYRKMVNRQIKAQKVSELYEYTKSNNLMDAELVEFYENFDNIFLNIYPNFVTGLNHLLIKEEQIELKKGELLNTELRIFALIRLGITDSSEIAKLLQYSINTIYNYRARVKNKAEGNRDDFEKLIMMIDAYSK